VNSDDYTVIATQSAVGAKPGHDRVVCECGLVVKSCRCMGPHNVRIVECTHGNPALIGPNANLTPVTGVVQPAEPTAAVEPTAAEKPVRPEYQQLPKSNYFPSMHDKAMRDLQARKILGAQRYGVALQPSNGRDAVRDAYEEALDGAAYGAQAVWEQDHPEETYVGVLIEMLRKYYYAADDGAVVFTEFGFGTKFVPPAVVSLLESHGFSVSKATEE